MHSSTREFCVGASLTIQPMFKANTPPVKAFSVRHLRLLSLSVGGSQDNCEISDYIVEALDEFPVKFNSVKVLKQVQDESSVVPYEPHAEGINDSPDVCDEAVRLIARYSEVFAVSDLETPASGLPRRRRGPFGPNAGRKGNTTIHVTLGCHPVLNRKKDVLFGSALIKERLKQGDG